MLEKNLVRLLFCLMVVLSLSATATMGANILFISSLDYGRAAGDEHMPGDDALKAFMEDLGHTVTYFDDDEDEATTEAAAAAADLVFISESVGSGGIREEITEIETPMIVAEPWAWDEMGLTEGGGSGQEVATTDIEIADPGHYLAAGLSGTVPILTDITGPVSGTARFSNGIAGNEATVIARATLGDGQTYDVFYIYEKGAALAQAPADGSDQIAADIRICLGFDYRSYPLWNENAYALLEMAVNWALGTTGPLTQARSPRPRDGAIDVLQDADLSWTAGTYADKHDVYFGTGSDDVSESSRTNPQNVLVSQNQEDTAYDPPGLLEFGQSYYWRIDEFNDTEPNSPWKGNTWSFKVIDHFIVEDFEDYNDYSPDEIFSTWFDGYGIETNGALVGHDADFSKGEHIVETTIVHGDDQSMPFFYDNSGTATYSEAERAFSPTQDWTREGVGILSLWLKGHPAYVGSFTEGPAGTYTMTASGEDIWNNSDQFHFAWKEVSGAASIAAKVESVENVHPFAKAGVMIRDTLDADSANAALFITPENGVRFQFRNATGGITDRFFMEGITAPQWVKLERTVGGLVRAYYSTNGTMWTQLDLTTVTMNTPMYIGLALTSHDTALTCEAKFSNVTSDGTGQWVNQDIGMLSNEAEPIYVTVEDGSGTSATVYHDDPGAALIDTWREWDINLKEFSDAGVVLTDVSKMSIGFGGAGDPQPGGSGLVFFDDIRLYLSRQVDLVITDGLVAYYAMENNIEDASGNGLHGTVVGGPTYAEGLTGYGMAMDFDGTDDVVELGKFDVVGGITLATWIKPDDFEINDARVITKANEWSGDSHWWMLSTMSETSLRFRLKTDEGPGTATLISDPVLEAGAWAHVAATWDGSMMRIFKDGVEVASQEKGGSAVAVDPAVSVAIGSQPSDAFASDPSHVAKFFDGLIDEVRIYNRALAGLEVLYLAGSK